MTGQIESQICYLRLKEKGISFIPIVLDTNWMFPEVKKALIDLYSPEIIILQHELDDLLKKRDWPSMRGGNKAWHLRELERTVDAYLMTKNYVEIIPFEKTHAVVQQRLKRKTKYITYSEICQSVEIDRSVMATSLSLPELQDIRDLSENHYLVPLKGFRYSSLRPKGDIEYFYRCHEQYERHFKQQRSMTTVEGIWLDLLRLNDTIEKKPAYFSGYGTLLDYTHEFYGRELDQYVPEYIERQEMSGRKITMAEFRENRIQQAIKKGAWLWAFDQREKIRWYPIKPLEFSESRRMVKTLTLDAKEKYLPITNLYSTPSEDYYGKSKI